MIYDYTPFNTGDDSLLDTESPGFLGRLNWLQLNSPARSWEISEIIGIGVGGFKAYPQAVVIFHGDNGRFVQVDGFLCDRWPNVALPELYQTLTPEKPLPNPFPKYNPVPVPAVDPVGDPWPQKGPNIWHVSAAFIDTQWPHGGPPFSKRVADGRDVTFYRTTVRGTSAPSGTVGGGAMWVPAWTDKKPA